MPTAADPRMPEPEFFDGFDLVLTRMDLFPHVEPENWVVGFTATCKSNQQSKYAFAVVPLEEAEGVAAMDIARMAWTHTKDEFLKWAVGAACRGCLLGQAVTFV